MNESQLIFIISQPRAGSTYLQNLLSNNSKVNTCSEPWLMLHLSSLIKPELSQATYDSALANKAFEEYLKTHEALNFQEKKKQFLLSLYQPMQDGYTYVIDKTPRYWELLNELIALFPKSRFIILKRNPFHVITSIIKTWQVDSLKALRYYHRDILLAPKVLQDFCNTHQTNPQVYTLRYEDLISDTKHEVEKLYSWLEVPFTFEVLDSSKNNKYKGKYGDPYQNTDAKNIDALRQQAKEKPLDPLFMAFLSGYAKYVGENFLKDYGNYKCNVPFKETDAFNTYLDFDRFEITQKFMKTSRAYKIGTIILKPIKTLKHFLS
ncbi:sulfotransferase family protein [Corallibacter sp.]|uniref:sulfotransferase family protein n=1 Tax=Corallibacter sp. TaxID=2038084 RepID=UPI003AB3ABC9